MGIFVHEISSSRFGVQGDSDSGTGLGVGRTVHSPFKDSKTPRRWRFGCSLSRRETAVSTEIKPFWRRGPPCAHESVSVSSLRSYKYSVNTSLVPLVTKVTEWGVGARASEAQPPVHVVI